MDSAGTITAHQMLRTNGSRFGTEVVLLQLDNSTTAAYINNLGKEGGREQSFLHRCGFGPWGETSRLLNTFQRYPTLWQTLNPEWTGTGQTASRLLKYSRRSTRLGDSGFPRGRPIRITTNLSVTTFFQLETRLSSSSSGCFSTGLDSSEGICQSPMVPSGEGTEQGGDSTDEHCAGGSSMESPGMVPCPTQDAESSFLLEKLW